MRVISIRRRRSRDGTGDPGRGWLGTSGWRAEAEAAVVVSQSFDGCWQGDAGQISRGARPEPAGVMLVTVLRRGARPAGLGMPRGRCAQGG